MTGWVIRQVHDFRFMIYDFRLVRRSSDNYWSEGGF